MLKKRLLKCKKPSKKLKLKRKRLLSKRRRLRKNSPRKRLRQRWPRKPQHKLLLTKKKLRRQLPTGKSRLRKPKLRQLKRWPPLRSLLKRRLRNSRKSKKNKPRNKRRLSRSKPNHLQRLRKLKPKLIKLPERPVSNKRKKQIAFLKQQMAERKAKFSNNFSHVWSNGEPGVSAFELNIDLSAGGQEEVIAKLFKNKIVADLEVIPGSVQRFIYNDEGHMDSRIEFIKLVGTVNDDRVEEFRALASHFTSSQKYLKGHNGLPAFDLVTYPIGTGSKEYIEWALE